MFILYSQINYKDNKDGTVSVNYLPTAPGEYKISVRFGDKNIKGSPFFAKVSFRFSYFSLSALTFSPNHVNIMKFNLIFLSLHIWCYLATGDWRRTQTKSNFSWLMFRSHLPGQNF